MRQKPEAARARAAIVIAAVFTGIVFLVWLSVVSVRLSTLSSESFNNTTTNNEQFVGIDTEQQISIDYIRTELSELFKDTKAQFELLREFEEEATTEPEEVEGDVATTTF